MTSEKKKKSLWKRWWVWAVAIIIIIIIAASHSGGNSSTNSSSNPSTTNSSVASSRDVQAKIGQTATVDKFAVTVNSVKYVPKIDDGGTGIVTQNGGVWLIVNVSIKNNDTTSRTLDSSMFTLLKGDAKYSASTTADIYINNNNDFFLSQVNPGLSATGNIAFNVPSQGHYELQVSSGMLGTSHITVNLQ